MRKVRSPFLVAATLASLTIAFVGCEPTEQDLHYRFSAVNDPVRSVADDSSHGHTASVRSNGATGATVAAITPGSGGTGAAVSFPAACPNSDPTCPRVMITSPDASDLNPGGANFRFGLRVRLTLDDLTFDHGSNLMQKGGSDTAQWKLQLDDPASGRPSCVLRPDGNLSARVRVTASVGVADGSWHEVACQREGDVLRILVDDRPAGSKALPATFSVTPRCQPLVIGGNGTALRNDQYHGDLDEVYFDRD